MVMGKIIKRPTGIKIAGATLLSIGGVEEIPKDILKSTDSWWLRSPGRFNGCAAAVHNNGDIDYFGYDIKDCLGVRPALIISDSCDLAIGDKLSYKEYTFTVISKKYILCDSIIGDCIFRENPITSNANNYMLSDVKKYVDDWFEKNINRG